MTNNILSSTAFQTGTISLYKGNVSFTGIKFYDDAVRGSNLVAKATQLVNDLEAARERPKFESIFDDAPDFLKLDSPEYFNKLLSEIKEQLRNTHKPLTVLNFIEARESLSAPQNKKLDIQT